MWPVTTGSVLAVLIGSLALLAGLLLMLLPLVASELARPRDSFWAAVVLLLGLVLVTASDRLTGAPMLGVLCGGLLIGRLGSEVGQQRWGLLSRPNSSASAKPATGASNSSSCVVPRPSS